MMTPLDCGFFMSKGKQMNTHFLLIAQYEKPVVELAKIAKDYLHIKDEYTANRKAAGGQLPFKTFRLGGQKSPYMVDLSDLAEYIDTKKAEANKDWEQLHG